MVVLIAAAASGCGWHSGPVTAGVFSAGAVWGTTAEPGLRPGIDDVLVRALAADGGPAGRPVNVWIESVRHAPVSAVTNHGPMSAGSPGAAAWESTLELALTVDARPECRIIVRNSLVWTTHPADPQAADVHRAQAMARLAIDGVTQGLDRLRAEPDCR